MHRIVIGLDGTDKDRSLVQWIADFADDMGAHVIAAHLIPRATVWMVAAAQANSSDYIEDLREHFEGNILRPFRHRDPAMHLHIYIGDPAHELAQIARHSQADLIAIGARAHTTFHDVVFGNIERQLLHLSDIPVLAVPHHTSRMHVVH